MKRTNIYTVTTPEKVKELFEWAKKKGSTDRDASPSENDNVLQIDSNELLFYADSTFLPLSFDNYNTQITQEQFEDVLKDVEAIKSQLNQQQ